MTNDSELNNSKASEIDLREIAMVLWDSRLKILSVTLVFVVCSALYAISLPNQYRATVLLAPAQQDSGGLSGMLGQLGGLASLAGVNISGGESSELQVAIQTMRSWSFIDEFIVTNGLAVDIYATKGWSRSSDKLIIDEDYYNSKEKTWLVEDRESGKIGAPSSWKLFKAFDERLAISEDSDSGLVRISIDFYSPQIAKKWVDLFVSAINSHMQKRKVERVSMNIEFLENQINKTSIAEMQGVFYTIIEEQIKAKMLAEAGPDYAFVTVSPSMIPEQKIGPKRVMICIVGMLSGVMLSILLILVKQSYREP